MPETKPASDEQIAEWTPEKYFSGEWVGDSPGFIAALIARIQSEQATVDRPRTENAKLREALVSLCNEVRSLGIAEAEIRGAVGNTNYECLVGREALARAALADKGGEEEDAAPYGDVEEGDK